MKKSQKLIIMVLVMAMLLTILPNFTFAVYAENGNETVAPVKSPAKTSNLGGYRYIYDRWATPINSYLVVNDDNTLTRVEYTGEDVAVETYDSNLKFVDGFTINMELPIFGGFHSGENYNFLVFGQENPNEDDTLPVIRVVSYTKEWQRVGAADLCGANTTIPFRAGCLRFAEYNGYLYIRTSHEMYKSSDGLNHQANLTMNVRISDMKITDSFYGVYNTTRGYVSHSLTQFIAVDGTELVAVDHGDAYPRSVVITKYNAPAGQDSFMQAKYGYIGSSTYRTYYAKALDVLPIMGSIGDNDTGVALGGFSISDKCYLIAGNTVPQDDSYDPYSQRNIFVSATDKDNFTTGGTTINYLTSYTEGDGVTLSVPHFVPVKNGLYAVLWTEVREELRIMKLAFVDEQGKQVGDIYEIIAVPSDCVPVVFDNKIVWYVTKNSAPSFFTIDLNNPEIFSHDHFYTYSYSEYPGYTKEGLLISECIFCGVAGENVIVPAVKGSDEYSIGSVYYEPTCTDTGYGSCLWDKADYYGVSPYSYYGTIPELGHDMTYNEGVAATCNKTGTLEHWSCSRCELIFADEDGETQITDLNIPVNPDNHVGETEIKGAISATCTKQGYTGDTVCLDCGNVVSFGTETKLADHNYIDHICHECGVSRLGDVNNDGVIDSTDCLRIKGHFLGTNTLEGIALEVGDVTKDGVINSADYLRIKSHFLGKFDLNA